MDLLIIGIDGGTAEIFDRFDMPFWKSLVRDNTLLPLREVIAERGWARMISGMSSPETGAMYMYPSLDRDRRFTTSYSYKDLEQHPDFVPIWAYALQAGRPVGMMNVPTTSPAQEVNGFYVAGGGGGLFQGGIPDGAVYPPDVKDRLERLGYIFDVRPGAESYHAITNLTSRLLTMMERRTRAFIDLARDRNIGFGFCAFRSTTVLLYLAMSEIERLARQDMGDGRDSSLWPAIIEEHFAALDRSLEQFFNELVPQDFMVVSDHSMVPWTHNVDFEEFLVQHGFARYDNSPATVAKNTGRLVLRPKFRRRAISGDLRSLPRVMTRSGARLSPKSRAFSSTYVHGIYVSDEERFAGPVPAKAVKSEVDKLVAAFNAAAQDAGHELAAEPYRAKHQGARWADRLPDVLVTQSGYAFPQKGGGRWIEPNPNYGPVTSLEGVGGMHTGQKGDKPLGLVSRQLASLVTDSDPLDLRLIHKLVQRYYRGDR